MKDEHIINLIESGPLASLSETDQAAIRVHTDHCSECFKAFQAAQVSSLLLKERAAEVFEPSPFFHTRVMATLRERQAEGTFTPLWTLTRLWRSAGALASTMLATVAALAVLTFVIPGNELGNPQPVTSLVHTYSAEEVILNETAQMEEQLTDDQLLTTIYGE